MGGQTIVSARVRHPQSTTGNTTVAKEPVPTSSCTGMPWTMDREASYFYPFLTKLINQSELLVRSNGKYF